jgi:hypothetical protein
MLPSSKRLVALLTLVGGTAIALAALLHAGPPGSLGWSLMLLFTLGPWLVVGALSARLHYPLALSAGAFPHDDFGFCQRFEKAKVVDTQASHYVGLAQPQPGHLRFPIDINRMLNSYL